MRSMEHREGIVPRTRLKTGQISLRDELRSLYEISNLVQESPVDDSSLEEILKQLGNLVDYRSASLFIVSRESEKLQEICTIGRTVDLIDFVNFNMGSGISAWVAQKKRHIVLNNLRKSKGGTHTKSFLSVPVVLAGEVTGVINLAHDEPDSFTKSDAEVVRIASSSIALLIERIARKKSESELQKEVNSLSEKLTLTREKLAEYEKLNCSGEVIEALNKNIKNSLAIIAGNAQFLLMTMKNPGSSVLKRLKAIDREVCNVIEMTENLQSSDPLSTSGRVLALENSRTEVKRE
jgi:transcriptional regulator with GAF, ATPase, and Fis domain